MADEPEDFPEELKKLVAEKVRNELQQGQAAYVQAYPAPAAMPYNSADVPPPPRPYVVTIDMLETGMVLRYSYPVKKVFKTPGRGYNFAAEPGVQIFLESMMEAVEGEGEDWNENKRGGKIRKIMDKLQALSAPKTIEKCVLETRSIACKSPEDLTKALETAKEAAKLVKELKDKGELGSYGQGIHGCFGAVPAVGGYPGDEIGGPDYSLGA